MPTTRNSAMYRVRKAFRKPGQVVPFVRRWRRNLRIHATASSHPEFYREVMADDVETKNPRGAVGTGAKKNWLRIGKFQFEYLTSHGLERSHHLLEIGCGNLRAGWRFIRWLKPRHYTGVDISPDILIEATRTIQERELQDRRSSLFIFDGTDLGFLPANRFDVVHAHSVFSHTPEEVVRALLAAAHRVLKPGGFFDFTYNESETGEIWGFLDEDFYYPERVIIGMAEDAGFNAAKAADWSYKQEKIHAVKPSE